MTEYERLKKQKDEIIAAHKLPGSKCPFGCPHEREKELEAVIERARHALKYISGYRVRLSPKDIPGAAFDCVEETLATLPAPQPSPAPAEKAHELRAEFQEHYDDCPVCGPHGDIGKEQTYTLCGEAMDLVFPAQDKPAPVESKPKGEA